MFHAADLMTARARITPEREALLDLTTHTRYTYAELNARANRAANFLLSLGVEKGDRVSILAQNSVIYLDLFYGVAKIGAIFAPLNWRLVARELEYIVNDNMPKVLLVAGEYVGVFQAMNIDVPHIVNIEGAQIDRAINYEDAIGDNRARRASPLQTISSDEPPRPDDLDGDTPYTILYTSGTTGQPKGAILPHRHILFNCINTVISWGLTENDVSPVLTPLFHAGGLFAFMTPILYAGGRVILGRTFNPAESLQMIHDEKCTVILGVPTLFQMWYNSPTFKTVDLSHVHFFISGGAPCPPKLIEAWRKEKNVVFRQGYGLTEVGPNCFAMTDEQSVPKTGSVGRPIFHSEMRLIDENGADVPVNTPGELIIKGPHVCSGYWNKPDATAKSIKEGWFYTGDMARMDEDGFFYIIGRAKDMIISGGENIYAAEVEAVFRQHDCVEDASLIGMPDDKWGEVGLMVVVLKSDQNTTEDELRTFCGERLARYKIPKKVVFAEILPYSPYGKVVKAELRERYL